jgi:hypothetical protein
MAKTTGHSLGIEVLPDVGETASAPSSRPNGTVATATLNVRVGTRAIGELVAARELSFARVYDQLGTLKNDLVEFFPQVPEVLPTLLSGQLLNPDGAAAAGVSVEPVPPAGTAVNGSGNGASIPWSSSRAITDSRGSFSLTLPSVPIPDVGLQLMVKGGGGQTVVTARRADLAVGGRLGVVVLDRPLAPLQQSILAQLEQDVTPASGDDVAANPADFADPVQPFTLGEGDCARSFRSNAGVIDRYAYSLLVRLVPPEVTPKTLVAVRSEAGRLMPMPLLDPRTTVANEISPAEIVEYFTNFGSWKFVDRVPMSAPIDVDGFLTAAGEHPQLVPKAATLGLGYALKLEQTWIPVGLSLGDIVYSLPLAPGEQQRVAVFEQTETQSVVETESLSIDELQTFNEVDDQSTLAAFNSAYREAASGGSSLSSESSTGSAGGSAGISFFGLFSVGGGGGYSTNSASSQASSWQQGSKDYASTAAQSFHSALGRHSAASRRSARTGMRLATATDTEQVTTRVVTNHNHGHALTMQWWEVLRHFSVASEIDDVQLVCFVPLELVDFLPPGQPRTLPKTGYSYDRDTLLARYGAMLRHLDVLAYEVRYRADFAYGLRLLREFAGNPTVDVQDPTSGTNEDEVDFSVTGSFLPIEDAWVTLVSKSGLRVGPVRLTPTGGITDIADEKHETSDEVLEELRQRRSSLSGTTLTAKFSLPETIARSDIARFEITRAFRPYTYKLKDPAITFETLFDVLQARQAGSVSYSAGTLEQEIGGPLVWDVSAKIDPSGPNLASANSGAQNAERMGTLLPVAALRVDPVLSFANLLRIEAVFQHVVSNTTRYSKGVWMSLTPEERAIMLEHYTIGVPQGGLPDASQEVPLLDCVANEVLGYFGNSAVMPFFIPAQVARDLQVTTRDVQEAIYKFHKQAFLAPRSSVTLPARGTLGEAILGDCDSCEKIDLTRFWNWQDSPADAAADPNAALFKGNVLAGVTGPSALTGQPVNQNLLTIGGPGPTAPNLAQELIDKAPQLTAFGDLTGMTQLQKAADVSTQASSAGLKTSIAAGQEMADTLVKSTADVLKTVLGSGGAEGKAKAGASNGGSASGNKAKSTQNTKAGVDKLRSNLDSYIKVAGNQSDQGAADSWAQGLISDIFGEQGIGVSDAAGFFDALQASGGDDAVATMGKTALLAALGL